MDDEQIRSILSPYDLDDDTLEYALSMLSDDPNDADVRESVQALIEGSIDDDDHPEFDIDELCTRLWTCLDGDSDTLLEKEEDETTTTRLLSNAISMKQDAVDTAIPGFGLHTAEHGSENVNTPATAPAANWDMEQIDIRTHVPISERQRRKNAQHLLREKLEEEERQRCLTDEMAMLEEGKEEEDDGSALMEENASNVLLTNFDLPNKRGGGADLLSNASLTLSAGRRYGLMGRNGCGKTTFMELMSQRGVRGNDGKCGIPKNKSMLLVRQEIVGSATKTAVDTVIESDARRMGLKRFIAKCEEELEQDDASTAATKQKATKSKKKTPKTDKASASVTEKLTRAYNRLAELEDVDGGDPEPRARKVLHGLGFSTDQQNKPTVELSGGWRMRVSLSCALYADPDLLLLDEPTNHLDLEAVLWLERYLTTQYKGTLMVVSHDRHFLNEIVTEVVHFHRGTLVTYRGDISSFEAVREENRARQIRLRENQESKKAHLQKYIDLHSSAGENGPKAARQRKSRMKKMEKIGVMAQSEGRRYKASYEGKAEEVEEYVEDEEVVLTFPDPGSFDGNILQLEQVSFGYQPEKALLLEDIDMTVNVHSRIALLGRNGCGKSTLIKILMNILRPTTGKSSLDARCKIEYLAQHQLDQLDPTGTPLGTMLERFPGNGGQDHILQLRRHLAAFGLGGEVLPNQVIHTMSGGQKCRLCLAVAMHRKPHLLILDEPTNHLDLETTQALIDAIRKFKGGVVVVSHDEHLLTSVCKELYVVEKGRVEKLKGSSGGESFLAYKKAVVQGRR